MVKIKTKNVYRSSISGRFVTKKYVAKSKKTTERQKVRVGKSK